VAWVSNKKCGMLIILNCTAKIRAWDGKKKLHFESGVPEI
jgi:hypothetical protein